MATTQIPWGDGSNDKLYFDADSMVGNKTVAVSSDPNTGASQRSKIVNFNASGVQPQPLQIVQLGSGLESWLKDGNTHLWINIEYADQLVQNLRLRMIGTIDWGDGTTESISVTTYTTKTHTYASTGKYRIDLKPSSGTFYLGGGSSSYNIMGGRKITSRTTVLYQAEIGTNRITTLSAYAFYYCVSLIRVYVPKTIVTVGSYAFAYCCSLQSIEFEDSSTITNTSLTNTFSFCYRLDNISDFAPPSITSFDTTYRTCPTLRKIIIPSTVTNISANTFYGEFSLKTLKCLPSVPPTIADANAFTDFPSGCVIEVPAGKLSAYQSANIWSNYASQMVEATSS